MLMTLLIERRTLIKGLAGAGAGFALGASLRGAFAQERTLDIHGGGNFTPVNIAIVPFAGDTGGNAGVTSVMTNNFRRSVFIAPIDAKSFPEQITNPDQAPNAEAWKTVNAQFVVTGSIGRGSDGRLKSQFRLWDVSTGQQVAGQQYATDPNNSRRVAHIISDAIFTHITGEKGWFDSRVVYVDETGPKENRVKRLAIMDQDGANTKIITRGDNLVVTPRFSPSAQEVAYMSFANGDPRVYIQNIETSQREPVGNFPGMTFSPRFSPDGQSVIMSLAEGANTNLYAMDLRTRSTTRLTNTQAIDTSPCYSPDGSKITFESDRGGAPQIYVMGSDGGGAQRISFGEGRYSTPVWSPKGDYIAFTKQRGGSFAIGVMKPDGSGERILTEGFHNEGPTWAPNGLYLMFFRDLGGAGGARIFMTDIMGRGEFQIPTPSYASDPSWGPLLG